MKNIFTTLLFVCICAIANGAPTFVEISSGKSSESPKASDISRNIEYVSDGIIITYNFSDAEIIRDNPSSLTSRWNLPGFGQTHIEGKPSLPCRTDMFFSYFPCDIEVSLIEQQCTKYRVALDEATCPEKKGNPRSSKTGISPYSGLFPSQPVGIDSNSKYKGVPIYGIFVNPMQYDYENSILYVSTTLVYKITYRNNLLETNAYEVNFSDPMFNNLTSLQQQLPTQLKMNGNMKRADMNMLIVGPLKYNDAIEKLARWKRCMGYKVTTATSDNLTQDRVISRITSQYNQKGSLQYLILIGNDTDVPSFNYTDSDGSYVSDFGYACMDGSSDKIPDFYYGRIPVNNLSELETVVDKIINYEKNSQSGFSFYNTALHCANFQDTGNSINAVVMDDYDDMPFIQTSEEIRNALTKRFTFNINRIYSKTPESTPTYWSKIYSNGKELPSELLNWPWLTTNFQCEAQIISAINKGVFYVLYNGHGNPEHWANPNFETTSVLKLTNKNSLPIIFSMCCQNAAFDNMLNGNINCFAHKLLTHNNGGAAAVFASSNLAYTYYTESLTEGMFDAIWPNTGLKPAFTNNIPTTAANSAKYQLGEILQHGILRMTEWNPAGGNKVADELHTRRGFQIFGDPSMMMKTKTPSYQDASVIRDNNYVTVNSNKLGGLITFYNTWSNEVICYNGSSSVSYETTRPEYVIVSITGPNSNPYLNFGSKVTFKF